MADRGRVWPATSGLGIESDIMSVPKIKDTQVIELIGRNRLGSEILRDGLEVAVPARDRGIDLIAYSDLLSIEREEVRRTSDPNESLIEGVIQHRPEVQESCEPDNRLRVACP
jgi:hypothetical protein